MALNDYTVSNDYLREMRQVRSKILEGDATWSDAQDIRAKYGLPTVTTDSIRRSFGAYDEFASKGWVAEPKEIFKTQKETVCLNADGSKTSEKIIALSKDEINDKESLLKAHGYDPVYYELVNAKSSIWQQGDGKGGTRNLYSSKITVKPTETGLDLEDIKRHFEEFKTPYRDLMHISKDRPFGKNIVQLNLVDIHFGRIAEDYETGNVYNMDIARNNMLKVANDFVAETNFNETEYIVMQIGQDYFNSSFTGYTTSQSHMQDNATTFNTIFKRGTEALIETIEVVASGTRTPVRVVFVSGNHSRFEESAMATVLEAYYRNSEIVTVDASPYPRKYTTYGNTCIGMTHGSDEKDRLQGLMQVENPTGWADSKYRYWMCGHLHHNDWALRENFGVSIFTLSAMTKMDNWTVKSGYTMANSGCTVFVFDYEKGLKDIKFFYV